MAAAAALADGCCRNHCCFLTCCRPSPHRCSGVAVAALIRSDGRGLAEVAARSVGAAGSGGAARRVTAVAPSAAGARSMRAVLMLVPDSSDGVRNKSPKHSARHKNTGQCWGACGGTPGVHCKRSRALLMGHASYIHLSTSASVAKLSAANLRPRPGQAAVVFSGSCSFVPQRQRGLQLSQKQ